jgi:hypothetical protein
MVGSSGASLTRNLVGQQPRQRRVVRRPPLKAEEEEAWRERRGTARMSVRGACSIYTLALWIIIARLYLSLETISMSYSGHLNFICNVRADSLISRKGLRRQA